MGVFVNSCPRFLEPTQRAQLQANAFMVCASLFDAAVLYEDMCCLQQWMHKGECQCLPAPSNNNSSALQLVPVCGHKRSREESSCCAVPANTRSAKKSRSSRVTPGSQHPASLQFALPFVSSKQTSQLAYELGKMGDELTWLNATHTTRAPVHQVFGWQTALWPMVSEDMATQNDKDQHVVVWKSAKAFEGKPTRRLAAKVWYAMAAQSGISVLYTMSKEVRVVRQQETGKRATIWLEVLVVRRDDICIMRKQLHHFESEQEDESAELDNANCNRQCSGLLFKPFLVPVLGRVVGGTTVSAIRSLNTQNCSATTQIARMVDDMPWYILDWEDAYINRPLH